MRNKFDPLLADLRTVDKPRVVDGGGGGTAGAVNVSDEAYGVSWNGVTGVAPSKNAVYDKVETLVVGPGSSTDNALTRFDGTTGKLIQNSAATLSDAGSLVLTGDGFQIRDASTPTKGYQFRTTGTNLDIDATGKDLYISTFTGTNFDGTQRQYVQFGAEFEFEKHYKKTIWDSGGSGDFIVFDKDGTSVFNEPGLDRDFRFEGDTDANLLFTDASQDAVSIGTGAPNAAAKLQVDSTTKGFLPPRMTTGQRDAIGTPPAGLVIYNTTTNKLNVYTTAWEAITSA